MPSMVAACYVHIAADLNQLKADMKTMRGEVDKGLSQIGKNTSAFDLSALFHSLPAPIQRLTAEVGLFGSALGKVVGGVGQIGVGLGSAALGIGRGVLAGVGLIGTGLDKLLGGIPSKLGAGISSMAGAIGSGIASVFGKVGGFFSNTFGGAARQVIGGLGTAFSGLIPIAGGVLSLITVGLGAVGEAITGAIGLLREWVNVAAEGEEVSARFAVAVKNQGDKVGYTADQFERLIAQTREMGTANTSGVKEGAFALLEGGQLRGDNFARTLALAQDLAGTMRGDVVGAARQLAHELQDPERGLAIMHREGIRVSAAIKAQVHEMMKQGDVMGAQGVLIDLLSAKYKGYGEAFKNTFQGQWQQFTGKLDEVKEHLLEAFLPAMREIVPLAQQLLDHVDANKSAIASWGQTFVSWVKVAAGWLKGAFSVAWEYVETALTGTSAWSAGLAQVKVWTSEVQDLFSWLGKVLVAEISSAFDAIGSRGGADVISGFWEASIAGQKMALAYAMGGEKAANEVIEDYRKQRAAELNASAAAMADNFAKTFAERMKQIGGWEDSAGTKKLKDDLAAANEQFGKDLKKTHEKYAKNEGATKGKPGAGMTPNPEKDPDSGGEGKFAFVGFTALYKQIQEGLSGGGMVSLTRQIVDQGKESNKNTAAIAAAVKALADKDPPFARAGPDYA